MHPNLEEIGKAAEGLQYISETDSPLQLVQLSTNDIRKEILQLSGGAQEQEIEEVSLDHFFRNAIRYFPGEPESQKEVAARFIHLKSLLAKNLSDVKVYRVGKIRVQAFILGRLTDGTLGGLQTLLVET